MIISVFYSDSCIILMGRRLCWWIFCASACMLHLHRSASLCDLLISGKWSECVNALTARGHVPVSRIITQTRAAFIIANIKWSVHLEKRPSIVQRTMDSVRLHSIASSAFNDHSAGAQKRREPSGNKISVLKVCVINHTFREKLVRSGDINNKGSPDSVIWAN